MPKSNNDDILPNTWGNKAIGSDDKSANSQQTKQEVEQLNHQIEKSQSTLLTSKANRYLKGCDNMRNKNRLLSMKHYSDEDNQYQQHDDEVCEIKSNDRSRETSSSDNDLIITNDLA